jgi:dienelactone hydrolase
MRHFFIFFAACCLLGLALVPTGLKGFSTPETFEKKSLLFIESLNAGTAGQNPEVFNAQMLAALQGFNLSQFWQQLQSQLGPFEEVTRFVHQPGERFYTILAVSKFKNAQVALRLVYDQEQKIAGMQVVEAPPLTFAPPPPYADTSRFAERNIVIDCGDIKLPGMLTMPKATHPVPVVVLVHGSGPHDMDQTIGPNKPFRDIAWGLASKGIAVLRYEKRTKNQGASIDLNSITPWTETGADAMAAARLAATLPGIDPKQVYVLGHSLGGMLAPKIAEKAGNLAGIIILGGNSGKLYDLVVRQLSHLAPIQDPDNRHGMKEMIEQTRQKASLIHQGKFSPNTPREETILNQPASYWLYIKEYDQVQTAAALYIRILVLQGERDYQVDMQEFEGWKSGLKNHQNTSFISYPGLNHLFFEGQGVSSPAEYNLSNNIDYRVIWDIAAWMKRE